MITSRRLSAFLLLSFLAMAVAPPAKAQTTFPNSFNNMVMTGQLFDQQRVFEQRAGQGKTSPTDSRHRFGPQASSNPADFQIGSDPAISSKVHNLVIGQLAKDKGKAVADQADRLFGNVRTTFAKMVQPYGLRDDNFADVMAAYMVVMWMSANQRTTLPPVAQVQAVRDQIVSTWRSPREDATQRQTKAEVAMYQICSAVVTREQAVTQNRPEMLATLAQEVRQSLSQQGIDMSRLTLTANGFQPR